MKQYDFKEFNKFLQTVFDYYEKPLTDTAVTIYFEGLFEHELGEIKAAFSYHARDEKRGKFIPKIADFMAHLPKKYKQAKVNPNHFGCSAPGCQEDGTISNSIHSGEWVCRKHF